MWSADVIDQTTVFVVVLREVLVARDIEMALRQHRPEVPVVLASSIDSVAAKVLERRIEIAFIQGEADMVLQSGLGQRLLAEGGEVVLVGAEQSQGIPKEWSVLPIPFSDDGVREVLDGFGRRQ